MNAKRMTTVESVWTFQSRGVSNPAFSPTGTTQIQIPQQQKQGPTNLTSLAPLLRGGFLTLECLWDIAHRTVLLADAGETPVYFPVRAVTELLIGGRFFVAGSRSGSECMDALQIPFSHDTPPRLAGPGAGLKSSMKHQRVY